MSEDGSRKEINFNLEVQIMLTNCVDFWDMVVMNGVCNYCEKRAKQDETKGKHNSYCSSGGGILSLFDHDCDFAMMIENGR